MVVTGGADSLVRVWLISEIKQVYREFKGHTAEITQVKFNVYGTWLYSASNDKLFKIWDT